MKKRSWCVNNAISDFVITIIGDRDGIFLRKTANFCISAQFLTQVGILNVFQCHLPQKSANSFVFCCSGAFTVLHT